MVASVPWLPDATEAQTPGQSEAKASAAPRLESFFIAVTPPMLPQSPEAAVKAMRRFGSAQFRKIFLRFTLFQTHAQSQIVAKLGSVEETDWNHLKNSISAMPAICVKPLIADECPKLGNHILDAPTLFALKGLRL